MDLFQKGRGLIFSSSISRQWNYKKMISEISMQQSLVSEAQKKADFERSQTQQITQASIAARQAGIGSSSSNNKIYALAGLALLVGGVYIIKKK